MSKKKRYRIRNGSQYTKALVKRGSLTLWFDEESIIKWHKARKKKGRGRPHKYADIAIQCMLTLETTMFRFKQIFGDRLHAILFENQAVEVFTKCNILNKMTFLGMPDSYAAIP